MTKKIKLRTSVIDQDKLHLADILIDHGVLCGAVGVDSLEYPA
jgi:hypothetical protein